MQELIERGFYTPEEARNSMNKNLVTRALGIDPEVQVDVQEDLVLKNDIFLLCSDGLNDMVEDEEIRLTIKENADNLEEAAKKLIQQANDNGGNDNVSSWISTWTPDRYRGRASPGSCSLSCELLPGYRIHARSAPASACGPP